VLISVPASQRVGPSTGSGQVPVGIRVLAAAVCRPLERASVARRVAVRKHRNSETPCAERRVGSNRVFGQLTFHCQLSTGGVGAAVQSVQRAAHAAAWAV
jgi:hypothetical protein